MRWGKRVIASQGTTLTPLPSGGPTDNQHLLFPSGESTRQLREAEAGVKGMKWGAKKGGSPEAVRDQKVRSTADGLAKDLTKKMGDKGGTRPIARVITRLETIADSKLPMKPADQQFVNRVSDQMKGKKPRIRGPMP